MKLWATLTAACMAGVIALTGYAGWTLRDMPQRGSLSSIIRQVNIFDQSGQLIAQRSGDGQFHIYKTLPELGGYAGYPAMATMAAEDRTFKTRSAIDSPALIRAAASDVLSGHVVSGGSTITRELVKIQLLGSEQTISRKLDEAFLGWAIERKYSKQEILEMYLNSVNYGHGAYGLESAVKTYFGSGMEPKNLSAAQAAFLAALLQAPNGLDPKYNWQGAYARTVYVLEGMQGMGVLTDVQEQQAEQEAKNLPAQFKYDASYRVSKAPQFVDRVVADAEADVGTAAMQQGVNIYTTLDSGLQASAEQAVSSGVSQLAHYGVNNGDLLAVQPSTGKVLAYVGSADYNNVSIGGQFDVIQAKQQPGSSFKPYVYAAALRDQKITLCSTLADTRTTYDLGNGQTYTPTDYDNRYYGAMSARNALVQSRNAPAVEVGYVEGMQNVDDLATSMGIKTQLGTNLATAIGASEVTMWNQVEAYGVFANQGRRVPLMDISHITSGIGTPLWSVTPGQQNGITTPLPTGVAYLINSALLSYPSTWGLGWRWSYFAGKSGTTNAYSGSATLHSAAWMMAYSPDIVVGAWAGNTSSDGNGHDMSAYGVNVGSTISAKFINALPSQYHQASFQRPSTVVSRGSTYYLSGTQNLGCSAPSGAPNSGLFGGVLGGILGGNNGNGNGRGNRNGG